MFCIQESGAEEGGCGAYVEVVKKKVGMREVRLLLNDGKH